MPLCKDPLVSHLKSLGLTVVYPPRSNLNPLELMLRRGKQLSRWGDAESAFVSDKETPEVKKNTTVNSIRTEISATHDLSIGLALLGTLLGQFSAKAISLKASYKNAKKLVFEYEDIISDYCDPLDIDKFLNSGNLDRSAESTREYLESDNLYIVSEVFKSSKISVKALDESGAAIEVEIPEIEAIGDVSVSVSSRQASNDTLIYEGSIPITFGIRALKIDYISKGEDTTFKLIKASSSMAARGLNQSISHERKEDFMGLANDEFYEF